MRLSHEPHDDLRYGESHWVDAGGQVAFSPRYPGRYLVIVTDLVTGQVVTRERDLSGAGNLEIDLDRD